MDDTIPAPVPLTATNDAATIVRVMVQHTPTLFSLLGCVVQGECTSTLRIGKRTYYRARSTPRWVLYKCALQGHGEFDPRQV